MSSVKKRTKKPAKRDPDARRAAKGFSAEERAAMKERVRELKSEASGGKGADGESEVLAKILSMPEPDRAMGKRLHALIRSNVPALMPRTWYGMPAYSMDGNVLCYFQGAHKFKARYAVFGFSDKAKLDEGTSWPVVYAIKELTPADEARIVALVKRAAG